MTRDKINYPEKPEDWNFPKEFLEYLNELDKARVECANAIVSDTLYQSFDYEWELEEEIPLRTILEYWNQTDKDLPDHNTILDEINDCMAETSYDDYVRSFYSY